jgi:hypothetical protein
VQAAAEEQLAQQLGVEAAAILLPAWRAAAASHSHQQGSRSLLQNNNRNRRNNNDNRNDDEDDEDEREDAPAWDAGINSECVTQAVSSSSSLNG